MPNGLVLLTALPPTKGHQALIQFALDHLATFDNGTLFVLVSTRSKEPIKGKLRVQAIAEQFKGKMIEVIEHKDDKAPQTPNGENDVAFWDYWKNTIETHTQAYVDGHLRAPIKYVYASEPYGNNVAKSLNAEFIPYDIKRDIVSARGTTVRSDPWEHYDHLMDSFKPQVQLRVTVFGSESIGKTTFAKDMVQRTEDEVGNNTSLFVPEWARTYLENHPEGVDVTPEKMEQIVRGQYASQIAASGLGKKLIIQDTDLLTTIGYYRIFGLEAPDLIYRLHKNADLYILLHSSIPFERDALRYGGHERQSTDAFWEDLLKEFGANYVSIETNDPRRRVLNGHHEIHKFNDKRFADLKAFVREI